MKRDLGPYVCPQGCKTHGVVEPTVQREHMARPLTPTEALDPAAIGQVTIQANRLFRVDLPFPSTLPEGVYDVRAYLLRDGKIVAAVSRPLPVGKVGFNAELAGWADNNGALYGLGAVFMAAFVGWLGGTIMRRL